MNREQDTDTELPGIFEAAEEAAALAKKAYEKEIRRTLLIAAAVDSGMALLFGLLANIPLLSNVYMLRGLAVGILLSLLALLSFRMPRTSLWAGLICYIAVVGITGYFYPTTVYGGIVVKVCIIIGFAFTLRREV